MSEQLQISELEAQWETFDEATREVLELIALEPEGFGIGTEKIAFYEISMELIASLIKLGWVEEYTRFDTAQQFLLENKAEIEALTERKRNDASFVLSPDEDNIKAKHEWSMAQLKDDRSKDTMFRLTKQAHAFISSLS